MIALWPWGDPDENQIALVGHPVLPDLIEPLPPHGIWIENSGCHLREAFSQKPAPAMKPHGLDM